MSLWGLCRLQELGKFSNLLSNQLGNLYQTDALKSWKLAQLETFNVGLKVWIFQSFMDFFWNNFRIWSFDTCTVEKEAAASWNLKSVDASSILSFALSKLCV